MDKIKKALSRFGVREKEEVERILEKIQRREVVGIDIKKLKGRKDIFRARKGNIRIVHKVEKKKKVSLLTIERRSERTYEGV